MTECDKGFPINWKREDGDIVITLHCDLKVAHEGGHEKLGFKEHK